MRRLARAVSNALLRRRSTIEARLVSTHIQQGRSVVYVDGIKISPQVSLVTRGEEAALRPIRAALECALLPHPELASIETYRSQDADGGLRDDESLRTISERRRRYSVPPLLGRLLHELARERQPEVCLELGTGYGVSTLYLLHATAAGRVVTLDRDPEVRDAALAAFLDFGVSERVRSVLGSFEEALPGLLAEITGALELVYEDGPHTAEMTLAVFEAVIDRLAPGGLLVFDDIYHRCGNTSAWRRIVADERLAATAEISGRQGICVKA